MLVVHYCPMCLGDVLVERAWPGEHLATLGALRLLVNPLVAFVNTLYVLLQVGASDKHFVASKTLPSFLLLKLRGMARMDMLDVMAEVSGVGADPAAGGALYVCPASPRQTGAGARVTAGVCLLITVTVCVLISCDQLSLDWRGLWWAGGLAWDIAHGEREGES